MFKLARNSLPRELVVGCCFSILAVDISIYSAICISWGFGWLPFAFDFESVESNSRLFSQKTVWLPPRLGVIVFD
jgi:hypothetical protein